MASQRMPTQPCWVAPSLSSQVISAQPSIWERMDTAVSAGKATPVGASKSGTARTQTFPTETGEGGGDGVLLGSAVGVNVAVAVGVWVLVGVLVGVWVAVGWGVNVAVAVGAKVVVGASVAVNVGAGVGVWVAPKASGHRAMVNCK